MDEASEYYRLTKLYKSFGDSELLELSKDAEQLTDIARSVLRSEIASRSLVIPSPDSIQEETEASDDRMPEFARLSSRDCVWEFAEEEDAQAAAAMLFDADIVYDMILPHREKLDLGAPRIAVLPRDVERVRQMLSKPIPEAFRLAARTPDDFAPPSCPRCRAEDPLLESVEPTNAWLCEVCGNTWRDAILK